MAADKRRRARPGGRRPSDSHPSPPANGAAGLAALEEIQRLLDAPLADLMGTPEEQAEAEELSRQAAAAPALVRLREVVAFVGKGRPATQAGNLKGPDAAALSRRLGTGEPIPDEPRSMQDVPETAHVFRWAAAAGFLARRGSRIIPGPVARDLDHDPLAAWIKATLTLLEAGVLDGFRQGWRKSYVEFLDANAGGLLAALAEAGGAVPHTEIDEGAWEQVAAAYGYEPDDDAERAHVAGLVRAMIDQFCDCGVVVRHDDEVVLTGLGDALAAVVAFSADDDEDDLDLVDTDAESLLAVCIEMEPSEASAHLFAWCAGRAGDEAAGELCEAILDDDDPDFWDLGFEALGMIDRAAAEPAVRRLRSRPGLRPRATAWLRGAGPAPKPPLPRIERRPSPGDPRLASSWLSCRVGLRGDRVGPHLRGSVSFMPPRYRRLPRLLVEWSNSRALPRPGERPPQIRDRTAIAPGGPATSGTDLAQVLRRIDDGTPSHSLPGLGTDDPVGVEAGMVLEGPHQGHRCWPRTRRRSHRVALSPPGPTRTAPGHHPNPPPAPHRR